MRIAFIGSVGVPNCYGGFESFLESCGPIWVDDGHDIIVTCYYGIYTSREPIWKGVRRLFIPIPANGAFSIVHDLAAFLSTFWRSDAVVVLGVSGGVWFPVMRSLCKVSGTKLVVNIDGVEWRRKSSFLRRAYLYFSDRVAQLFSHAVVYDNEALYSRVLDSKKPFSFLIPYPGDSDDSPPPITTTEPPGTPVVLTICRIEPENNCHLLLDAAAKAKVESYIFIGNWTASPYGIRLRKQYETIPGFELIDSYYDKEGIARYRSACDIYLHGHSVGGTNPSLVEMLFFDCEIIAFDCAYNRATAMDAISYFASVEELQKMLTETGSRARNDRTQIRERYTRKRICDEYLNMLQECQKG